MGAASQAHRALGVHAIIIMRGDCIAHAAMQCVHAWRRRRAAAPPARTYELRIVHVHCFFKKLIIIYHAVPYLEI